MLKSIPTMIDAELLWILRSMGHGDTLVICDANFPATSVALHTVTKKLVRLAGVDTTEFAEALFKLFPLDSFVDHPIAGKFEDFKGDAGKVVRVEVHVLGPGTMDFTPVKQERKR